MDGSVGCVLAARLSEDERISVGLIEAGPDYGPFDMRTWPGELLDARSVARGHDWDLTAPVACARAKVIGGSSAHNGCWAVIGAPLCCGTYGNPPLLMRSGVGPEAVLRELGAPVLHPLAGVGENLVDHGSLGLMLDPLPA